MSAKYVKFDPVSGRILFCGEVPECMIELQGDGVWVGDADPQFDYMRDGVPVKRPMLRVDVPASIRADGADELVLPDVPAGAQLRVAGPVSMSGTTERAGDVSLTFALAGEYRIAVESFPFLPLEITINAF